MADLLDNGARTGTQLWARLHAEGHGEHWTAAADYSAQPAAGAGPCGGRGGRPWVETAGIPASSVATLLAARRPGGGRGHGGGAGWIVCGRRVGGKQGCGG